MPVKLHWLRIPTQRNNPFFLVFLVIGILLAWAFVYGALAFLLTALAGFPDIPPEWIYHTSVVAALAGPVFFAYFVGNNQHARLMRRPHLRTERLKSIVTETRSIERLPHRLLEHVLRGFFIGPFAVSEYVRRLPTGSLAVAVTRDQTCHSSPTRCRIPFEPVEITEDSSQILNMTEMFSLRTTGQGGQSDDTAKLTKLTSFRFRKVRKKATEAILIALALPYTLFVFYQAITATDAFTGAGFGLVFLVLVFSLTRTLIFERRWWLVPGGLIYREDRIWRKGLRWGIIRASESQLMIDMRTGVARVLVNDRMLDSDRVLRIRCAKIARWVVVPGWASEAPSPTDVQVRAFLGIAEPPGEARHG